MVILNESSQATGMWGFFIGILLCIAGLVILIICELFLEKLSNAVLIPLCVLALVFIIGALIIFGKSRESREKTYNVYLHDMSLEEFETEYEPIKIDGLIITARRKSDERSD